MSFLDRLNWYLDPINTVLTAAEREVVREVAQFYIAAGGVHVPGIEPQVNLWGWVYIGDAEADYPKSITKSPFVDDTLYVAKEDTSTYRLVRMALDVIGDGKLGNLDEEFQGEGIRALHELAMELISMFNCGRHIWC
jgi:hypothetical protein